MGDRIRECYRCGKTWGVFHKHHVDRRINSDEVVDLCPECHAWVHANPSKAREIGLYNKISKIEYSDNYFIKKKHDK